MCLQVFCNYFVAICELKLELQSRNSQFGSKSVNFWARVTLTFDRWPWKSLGNLIYSTSSFVHHFIAICGFKLELQSGNAQIGAKLVLTFLRGLIQSKFISITSTIEEIEAFCFYFKLIKPIHKHHPVFTSISFLDRPQSLVAESQKNFFRIFATGH